MTSEIRPSSSKKWASALARRVVLERGAPGSQVGRLLRARARGQRGGVRGRAGGGQRRTG